MIKQTERIKISSLTKHCLERLKTEENWTFNSVIQTLIDEHDELNDPDIIEEKASKLKEEYVDRSEYSRLYDENNSNKMIVKDLEDKLEETVEGMKEEKEGFIVKFKEQQKSYDKLQSILAVKESELKTAHRENEYFKEELKELKEELDKNDKLRVKQDNNISDTQEQYDSLKTRYNKLVKYIEQSCIELDTMKTFYHIVRFLSKHKKSHFTSNQLYDKMTEGSRDEITGALLLSRYRIFPVAKYLINDIECYGFDRQYLKR